MKVTSGKPISTPSTSVTNAKSETNGSDFLDLMSDANFSLPDENQSPADTATTNLTQDNSLETNVLDNQLVDIEFAENARDVSDLIQDLLKHDILPAERLLANENKSQNVLTNTENTIAIDMPETLQNTKINADVSSLDEENLKTTTMQAAIIAAPMTKVAEKSVSDPIKNETTTFKVKEAVEGLTQDDDLLTKDRIQPKPTINMPREEVALSNPALDNATITSSIPKQINSKRFVITEKSDGYNNKALSENMVAPNFIKSDISFASENRSLHQIDTPIKLTFDIDEMKSSFEASSSVNQHHIRISINPVELGPVTAQIRYENNRVELDISAKNNDVTEMIKAHLIELREQLNQMNIKLDSINVQNMSDNGKGSNNNSNTPHQPLPMDENMAERTNTVSNTKSRNKQKTLVDTYI